METSALVDAFRLQAIWCGRLGSPLCERLLERAAEDVATGGPIAHLIADWSGDPLVDALPIRLLGAVHDRVLSGTAPELEGFYPSVGGTPEWPDLREAFVAFVASNGAALRPRLDEPVQTNEVNRSAALLGGFLQVAAWTRLPFRLLEIGASAGLNQFWDLYRYELGEHRWGEPASPVVLRADWEGGPPALGAAVTVASRAGCDLNPIDLSDARSRRRLESFVWPDQLERLANLRSAIRLAMTHARRIERASASAWLAGELAEPRVGLASVIYHSIVWWYLGVEEGAAVTAAIEQAGERATKTAPIAWLRLEVSDVGEAEIRLRLWPGGEDVLLGRADPHGRRIVWG